MSVPTSTNLPRSGPISGETGDDLTDFDYDHEGWFLNMVGMY